MLTSRICNRLIKGDVMMILCLVMKICLFYNSGNVTIQYIFLRTKNFFPWMQFFEDDLGASIIRF